MGSRKKASSIEKKRKEKLSSEPEKGLRARFRPEATYCRSSSRKTFGKFSP